MYTKYKFMRWTMAPDGTQHWNNYRVTPLWDPAADDYGWHLEHGQGDELDLLGVWGTGHTEEAKAAALRHAGQYPDED